MNASEHLLIIGMVGLPSTGKTRICRKIASYLSWIGLNVRSFNFDKIRQSRSLKPQLFDAFQEDQADVAHICLAELFTYIVTFMKFEGGQVAILDAQNLTQERRRRFESEILYSLDTREPKFLWIQSIQSHFLEDRLLETWKVSLFYKQHLEEKKEAVNTMSKAVEKLKEKYETLSKAEIKERRDYVSLIQVFDFGKSVKMFNLANSSPIFSKIPAIIANIANCDHDVILVPSGLDFNAEENRVGGDRELSMLGHQYGKQVNSLLESLIEDLSLVSPHKIFLSKEKRSIQTRKHLTTLGGIKEEEMFFLHGINYGKYDGFLRTEIPEDMFPEKQPLPLRMKYRFPNGESYGDIIQRVDPLIFQMERTQETIAVICDPAIMKSIYAYFTGYAISDVPSLMFKPTWVVKLHVHGCGCDEIIYEVENEEQKNEERDIKDLSNVTKKVAKIFRECRRESPEFRSPFRRDSFDD